MSNRIKLRNNPQYIEQGLEMGLNFHVLPLDIDCVMFDWVDEKVHSVVHRDHIVEMCECGIIRNVLIETAIANALERKTKRAVIHR